MIMCNKQTKDKKGIFKGYKILWSIMRGKEKICCSIIFLLVCFVPFIHIYTSFLPSLILSRIINENIKILGFIDLSMLSNTWYYIIVIMIVPIMWIFGMLIYRSIDIFARRMMCLANERVQDLLVKERKNLDFKLTNGEVNYIVKNAVDNIYNIIEPSFWEFLTGILTITTIIIQLFIFNFNIGLMGLAYFALLIICVLLRNKIQIKITDKIEEINSKIGNHFLMSLTNLPVITMFSSKFKELSVLKQLNKQFFKENKKRANICFWYWVLIIFVEYTGILGIIIYLLLSNQDNLATTITTVLTMLNYLMTTVENWGYSLNELQTSSIKLCNLTKIYPDEKDLIKNKKRIYKIEKIDNIEIKKYFIKFENFQKEYNQIFESGKIYLISGSSGSGKTTLINAMCGLRETENGYLIINKKYKVKNLYNYRDKIVYLFQDSLLFDRSLKENITYPEDELNEKTKKLLKKFNMITLMNRTVDSSINNLLSGGEKKRVNIIRTLSKDKSIYLFDEPTNELDNINVKKVLEEIKNLAKENKIVIIISHDERCLKIADIKISL